MFLDFFESYAGGPYADYCGLWEVHEESERGFKISRWSVLLCLLKRTLKYGHFDTRMDFVQFSELNL